MHYLRNGPALAFLHTTFVMYLTFHQLRSGLGSSAPRRPAPHRSAKAHSNAALCSALRYPAALAQQSAALCSAVFCRALPCFAVLRRALPCFAVLCRALPCFAVLCRALPCFAVLCRALPCFAVLCHAACFAVLFYYFVHASNIRSIIPRVGTVDINEGLG